MLRHLFTAPMVWLDGSAGLYWLVGAVLLTLVLAAAQVGKETTPGWWRHPGVFLTVLVVSLFFLRLPIITSRAPFNEDESYFLAGALTLRYDPLFWRSVQSTSAGPLNYYLLLLPGLVGMPLDFLAARVIATTLFALLLITHYALVRRFLSDDVARLCTLPIWALVTFVSYLGLVNYHSELVSMTLMEAATYFLLRYWGSAGKTGWLVAASVLLGCLPWAKLQSAPAGIGIALVGLAMIVAKKGTVRQGIYFAMAGLAPTILVFALTSLTGLWDSMWLSYLRWNMHLAEKRTEHFSLWGRCQELATIVFTIPAVREFFVTWTISVVGAALLWRRGSWRRLAFPLLLGAVPLVLLAFGILVSGNILSPSFSHYLLFLFFPAALMQASLVGLGYGPQEPAPLVLRGLAMAATLYILWSSGEGPAVYLQHAAHYDEACIPDIVTSEVLTYSREGDTLFVWGWAPRYFPLTQRVQATPFPATEHEFDDYQTDYFRRQLLQRLDRSKPPVIIDEVGDTSILYQDRSHFGHEVLPALRQYIAENYVQVGAWPRGRVYVRKEVLEALPVPESISRWDFDMKVHPEQGTFARNPCFAVEVTNRGRETWHPHGQEGGKGKIVVEYEIAASDGNVLQRGTAGLREPVTAGATERLVIATPTRPEPGTYELKVRLRQLDGSAAPAVGTTFRVAVNH